MIVKLDFGLIASSIGGPEAAALAPEGIDEDAGAHLYDDAGMVKAWRQVGGRVIPAAGETNRLERHRAVVDRLQLHMVERAEVEIVDRGIAQNHDGGGGQLTAIRGEQHTRA